MECSRWKEGEERRKAEVEKRGRKGREGRGGEGRKEKKKGEGRERKKREEERGGESGRGEERDNKYVGEMEGDLNKINKTNIHWVL